jgi:hypothetical protein
VISLTTVISALAAARPALPAGLPWFRQVEGGAAFARVAALPNVPLPGCWIVRTAEKSTPAGERVAHVSVTFDVVMAVTNVRMATGGDADDALLHYRQAVLQVLQELAPWPETVNAIERVSGAAIEYSAGDLWWKDTYTATVRVTNYLPDPAIFERVHNPQLETGASL